MGVNISYTLARQEITSAITTPNMLIPVPNEQMKVVCTPSYMKQLTGQPFSSGSVTWFLPEKS